MDIQKSDIHGDSLYTFSELSPRAQFAAVANYGASYFAGNLKQKFLNSVIWLTRVLDEFSSNYSTNSMEFIGNSLVLVDPEKFEAVFTDNTFNHTNGIVAMWAKDCIYSNEYIVLQAQYVCPDPQVLDVVNRLNKKLFCHTEYVSGTDDFDEWKAFNLNRYFALTITSTINGWLEELKNNYMHKLHRFSTAEWLFDEELVDSIYKAFAQSGDRCYKASGRKE